MTSLSAMAVASMRRSICEVGRSAKVMRMQSSWGLPVTMRTSCGVMVRKGMPSSSRTSFQAVAHAWEVSQRVPSRSKTIESNFGFAILGV